MKQQSSPLLFRQTLRDLVDPQEGLPRLDLLKGACLRIHGLPRLIYPQPTAYLSPPPLVPNYVGGDAVQPCRDLRVATKLGQAALHDQKDLVDQVVDLDRGAGPAPCPASDIGCVSTIDCLQVPILRLCVGERRTG